MPMTDQTKEHRISNPKTTTNDGQCLPEGIVEIECSCGWSIIHERKSAIAFAERHQINEMGPND